MRALAASLILATASLLAGCVENPSDASGSDATDPSVPQEIPKTPYRPLPDSILGLELTASTEVPTGAGIWLYGHHAYVGARGEGFYVVDIMDPARPVIVGHIEYYARDVDLLVQGDRLIAVLAAQGEGMHVIDVTDPTTPVYLATVMGQGQEVPQGEVAPVHNVAVPPGQDRYAYNSRSSGEGGKIDVVDLADPEDPLIVNRFGTHGCHDITFLDLPDKKRAYCAGVDATQIYDLGQDVVNPPLIANIDLTRSPTVGHGGLHHLAMPNLDGTLLIIGDEYAGGGGPGCWASATAPVAGTVSSPVGALTFFDMSDESSPEMLSWISPPPPVDNGAVGSCTAHFGRLIEDRPQLVMGWYTAGVVMVDFSDPSRPYIVDDFIAPGMDVWDAQVYQGYVFTGDIVRGLDVLTFG